MKFPLLKNDNLDNNNINNNNNNKNNIFIDGVNINSFRISPQRKLKKLKTLNTNINENIFSL